MELNGLLLTQSALQELPIPKVKYRRNFETRVDELDEIQIDEILEAQVDKVLSVLAEAMPEELMLTPVELMLVGNCDFFKKLDDDTTKQIIHWVRLVIAAQRAHPNRR